MMGCAVQHKGPGASNRWEEESGTAGGPTALLPFSWWCLSDSPACRQVVPSATFIEEEKQNNKSHVFQHGQIQKALSGSFYIQLYYYIQLIKSPILWVKLTFRCNKFLLPPRTKKQKDGMKARQHHGVHSSLLPATGQSSCSSFFLLRKPWSDPWQTVIFS